MKNIFKKIVFLCTALLALSLGTSVNKVETAGETYVKVTSELSDWSGKYVAAYVEGSTGYVFNGVDAANGYVSATVDGDSISSNEDLSNYFLTISYINKSCILIII